MHTHDFRKVYASVDAAESETLSKWAREGAGEGTMGGRGGEANTVPGRRMIHSLISRRGEFDR